MPAPPRPPVDSPLVRSLGTLPAMAIILANIIGTGVFLKARVMTANVGDPRLVLLAWLAAGALSFLGALVYAELGALLPRAGGEYNYLAAAYGRTIGFLYGWSRLLVMGVSSAAVAIAVVTFLDDLTGHQLPPTALRLLPGAVLLLAVGLNLASVEANGRLAMALAGVKIGLVLSVGVGACLAADGSWSHLSMAAGPGGASDVPESARGGLRGFGAAMLGALFAYNGWNIITNLAGEVRRPGLTLPRSLLGATGIAIGLYVLANAGYFHVLTPREIVDLPASTAVATEAARRFLGPAAATLMAAGLLLSAYGTIHVGILAGPRLPYALARDGLLPAPLAIVSRRGVPYVTVLLVGAWSVLGTLTATFDVLTDIYVIVLWLFYGLSGAALFVLRRQMPSAERPYRVPGYPAVPALFVLVVAALLVNTVLATPGRALAGLGLVASGIPVHWLLERWRRKESAGP